MRKVWKHQPLSWTVSFVWKKSFYISLPFLNEMQCSYFLGQCVLQGAPAAQCVIDTFVYLFLLYYLLFIITQKLATLKIYWIEHFNSSKQSRLNTTIESVFYYWKVSYRTTFWHFFNICTNFAILRQTDSDYEIFIMTFCKCTIMTDHSYII
jgi:hypothetical protein